MIPDDIERLATWLFERPVNADRSLEWCRHLAGEIYKQHVWPVREYYEKVLQSWEADYASRCMKQ